MIKFFGLIPRRPDMSVEEFHDHYRHPHGTLGAQIPALRGYVQCHQVDTELLGPGQRHYQAVAENWYDTVEDAVGLAEDPHYVEHVKPDEPLFVDIENLKWLFTCEEVVVSGPKARADIPLAEKLLRNADLGRPSTAKLLHFAVDDGVELDRGDLAGRLDAIRHVHCRPHPEIHGGEDRPAFAEVHELWWPTVWEFEQRVGPDNPALRELNERDGAVTLLATAERFI